MEKDLKGKILDGKSYKLGKTPKGHMEVKFCIKEGDIYHNLKTHLEPGLDLPPYLAPGQEIVVCLRGGKQSSWEWNGKTYNDTSVHISMIRRGDDPIVNDMVNTPMAAKEVGFPPKPASEEVGETDLWEECYRRFTRLIDVYKPTQAGDLKEIARMAGF